MKNILNIKKTVVLTGLAITGTLLSGCSLDEITGKTAEVTPTPVSTETEVLISADTSVITNEISDEAFEKAFAKYLKENPIKFGKQFDGAYKIYRDDAQKEQAAEQAKKDNERGELIKNVRDISATDHVEGNKDAEFVLFEYSDYHCPYCKRFDVTTKEFVEKNSDVAVVLRAYPAVHKTTAQPIHEAAECVAKESGNEAFWIFSNNAFETQFRKEDIKAKLDELKIANAEKIMKCYADRSLQNIVDDSAQEAVSLGIQGTPGSILKNIKTGEVRFINGAQPLAALEAAKKELSEIK